MERRRTLATDGGHSTSIPMSTARKQRPSEYFASASNSQQQNIRQPSQNGGARYSMAPSRVVSRQSMAPPSSYDPGGGLQQQPFFSSQQSSQGSAVNGYTGASLNVPATVSRQSHAYSSVGHQQLGMSGARGDAGFLKSSQQQNQPYAPPSIRRSSTGRRQSSNPSHPPTLQHFVQAVRIAKDPRNVRDRSYLSRCQNEILDFLTLANYPDNLTHKTLAQPTGKDFANIFKFIYTLFDPSHKTWGKKFEEDVSSCLKSSGYPFADSISRSHLQAVGNMHSWPGIVAMLHWLVTSIKARSQVIEGYDEVRIDVNAPQQQPDDFERPQAKTEYWAEYLAGLYPAFLASEDYDATPYAERLEERFQAANERSREKIAFLEEECEKLQVEKSRLEDMPSDLQMKQKEQKFCQKDMEAINKYVSSLQDKSARIEKQIEEFRKRIAEFEQVQVDRETERATLKNQVDAQGLTDHEIQKLTSDRHQLDEAHRITSTRLSETMQNTLDLEVSLSRNFNRVEKLAEHYHALATKLGLLPTGPEGYEDVNFAQELNGSASIPQNIVPDCTTRVKPAITQMKQVAARGRHENGNQVIQVEEELQRVLERLQDVGETVGEAEARHDVLTKEVNQSKEALNQYMATANASIDQMSRQINELRTHMSGGLLAVDQRLQSLDNEHSRLLADVERLRLENHEAFAEQLEAIISYKQYVTTQLDSILNAATSS